MDISKSTLSYHLKRLSAVGLITVGKGGGTMVSVNDPEKLAGLLVWVGGDVERDAADALVDVWNRLRDR
jgi:DNA-binding transcriptional ArsR family regulator